MAEFRRATETVASSGDEYRVCPACRYSTVGFTDIQRCPECGTMVDPLAEVFFPGRHFGLWFLFRIAIGLMLSCDVLANLSEGHAAVGIALGIPLLVTLRSLYKSTRRTGEHLIITSAELRYRDRDGNTRTFDRSAIAWGAHLILSGELACAGHDGKHVFVIPDSIARRENATRRILATLNSHRLDDGNP